MKKTGTAAAMLLALALLAVLLIAGCAGPAPATPAATPVPTAAVTPGPPADVWQQVQQNGRMVVGTSADYPPFEFYNSQFQLDGFDIALAQQIGKKLNVAVEFKDMAFEGLGGALQTGQIDTAISAISVTPEREQQFDFSNVYYVGQSAALAAGTWQGGPITHEQQLTGLRIGVQGGSIYQSWAQTQLVDTGILDQKDLNVYTDIGQAVQDLKAGRIQLVLLDLAPAQAFEKQGGVKVVGKGVQEQNFAIALPLNQAAFRRVLNRALNDLRADGTIDKLAEQYLGVKPEDLLPVPTPVPETPTPTPAPSLPTPVPTVTPTTAPAGCVDGMAWVADLTFDDRNMTAPPVVPPGQPFVKSWRVRNSGTCTWNSNYFLGFDRGNVPAAQMGGQPAYVVGTVPPGATYDFSVNLVAPTAPGVYQGFWQMRNARAVPFGQTIWVGISVPVPVQPTPAPTATPVPGISFSANPTTIQQGQCTTITWYTSNVQEVYYYQQGQDWRNHGVVGQGTRTECPQQTTTYYLRVVMRDGQVVTPSVTVTVNPVATAPQISQFTINPTGPIIVGQCVMLQWRIEGTVTRVVLSRNTTPLWDGAPYQGASQDCPPAAGPTTYLLQATGPGGAAQASQYLQVNTLEPTQVPPTYTPGPPPPTYTPIPVPPTYTPAPPPTYTPVPPPTHAPEKPTDTPVPPPTYTPVPPTYTPLPPPTYTPVPPPTDTPVPPPTYTPVPPPPTDTPVPPPPAITGNWALASLNGKPLEPGTDITANFDASGHLSGSGGCNSYNTSYSVDGNNVRINPPVATQMICDEAVTQQESSYFQTLPFAFRFERSGSSLTIYNDRNTVILQYAGG